mmetsp:Transcript_16327/g.41322  ORF Transcript_16327/g.41322 Transcript_16327/m.41322 type:complete len:221 (-) Transcript_16327:326-988(-)
MGQPDEDAFGQPPGLCREAQGSLVRCGDHRLIRLVGRYQVERTLRFYLRISRATGRAPQVQSRLPRLRRQPLAVPRHHPLQQRHPPVVRHDALHVDVSHRVFDAPLRETPVVCRLPWGTKHPPATPAAGRGRAGVDACQGLDRLSGHFLCDGLRDADVAYYGLRLGEGGGRRVSPQAGLGLNPRPPRDGLGELADPEPMPPRRLAAEARRGRGQVVLRLE